MSLWEVVGSFRCARYVKYHQPFQLKDCGSNNPVAIEKHLNVSSFCCCTEIRGTVSVAPLNTVVLISISVAVLQKCHLLTA